MQNWLYLIVHVGTVFNPQPAIELEGECTLFCACLLIGRNELHRPPPPPAPPKKKTGKKMKMQLTSRLGMRDSVRVREAPGYALGCHDPYLGGLWGKAGQGMPLSESAVYSHPN